MSRSVTASPAADPSQASVTGHSRPGAGALPPGSAGVAPARLILPGDYTPALGVRETQAAIKRLKDFFELALAAELNLTRVSAPLFVPAGTGLNDNLNGVEEPVAFQLGGDGRARVEMVQSLAKWKRHALARYGFGPGEGLYTDMNAVRKDELPDNLHSVYVDQWDWEKVIRPEERSLETLEAAVRGIYKVLRRTEAFVARLYPDRFTRKLPPRITFLTTQELEDRFPSLTPRERENRIAEQAGAVCLEKIGGRLRSGRPHDGRSPDYDDWELNADIIVWDPVLGMACELSSMGIRVDAEALCRQLAMAGCLERLELDFHRRLLEGKLPATMGGGIGQSRLCLFFLEKVHIGEVQASVWPPEMVEACSRAGIPLL